MARLDIVNPVSKTVEYSVKPAVRPRDLTGATIGLYWNMKAGGDAALDRTEALPDDVVCTLEPGFGPSNPAPGARPPSPSAPC
jgi:hypothetical protein